MGNLFWVIQKNLRHEQSLQDLFDAMTRFDLDHVFIDIQPFTYKIDQDVSWIKNPVICMGSTKLVILAKNHGWVPGTFHNDNFSYIKYVQMYKDEMFNHDAICVDFKDLPTDKIIFTKPDTDLKLFSAEVMFPEDIQSWKYRISQLIGDGTYCQIQHDTKVIYCSPKETEIFQEYRLFVINGKVITASLYKIGDRVVYNSYVDQYIIDYGNYIANLWSPGFFYALDIVITKDGPKVLEINCGESAGFYASNVFKIVEEVELNFKQYSVDIYN